MEEERIDLTQYDELVDWHTNPDNRDANLDYLRRIGTIDAHPDESLVTLIVELKRCYELIDLLQAVFDLGHTVD